MAAKTARKVFTAIGRDGKTASEVHREIEVEGQWFTIDPVPMTQAELGEWAKEFNTAVMAELEQTKELLDFASKTIETRTAERDKALAEIEKLKAEIASIKEAK